MPEAKQIHLAAGQSAVIHGGSVWAGLPDGTTITVPIETTVIIAASGEFNLVPINQPPPIQISPTSPVTVQPGPTPATAATAETAAAKTT